MAIILDGKALLAEKKPQIKRAIERAAKGLGAKPSLGIVVVSGDDASLVYAESTKKTCEEYGVGCEIFHLPSDASEKSVIACVESLNQNKAIHGILINLPLPRHINEEKVLQSISPLKDVDGVHFENIGRLASDSLDYIDFVPATPLGIMAIIKKYNIQLEGKHCVVVGRSNILGKPLALRLLNKNATVTICHSRTKDLSSFTKQADVLISCVGKVSLITADMVKEGAVVIDAGMNRNAQGKLCGDVDYDEVAKIASHITPVPGGVGATTRMVLMINILIAAKKQAKMHK